ncbi:MAG: TonB-dependent receptor [Comamonadaceae bacterium]|nr:MAG: TonB-dependent receptor [Comamonadaceae bacterium]
MTGASLTLATVLGGPAAWAQASPDAAALPPVRVQASPEFKVEESSSGKFTAPLIDTPKTVTVIPQEVMRQINATTLTEALRTTPGITFGAGEGGNPVGDRPFLRGYDSQSSTYVDGLRDIAPSTREVFNLESVEVVKGPDSTSGGRGGAGGTIQLYSKTPKKDNFFTGSVGLGTDSYKRATLDVNRMLSDTVAVRLNAMGFDADVPGRNGPNNKRWGIAPSISFGLGTPTRVTVSYIHMQTDDVPDGGVPYYLPSTFPRFGEVRLQPTYGGNRENWYGVHGRDFRKDKSDALTVQVEHDITADLKFKNVTRLTKSSMDYIWTQPDDSQGNVARGLVWRRFNGSLRDIDTLANLSELSGKAQTGSVKHSYTLGLELSREKAANDSFTQLNAAYTAQQRCPAGAGIASSYVCTSLFNPTPNDPWLGSFVPNGNPAEFRTDTASLYAFDTMELTPQWLLSAGLRLDRYKTEQDNAFPTTTAAGGTSLPRLSSLVRPTFSRTDTLLNYQLGVVYKPASNGSIYASIGTSSTPGGNTLGQGQESQALSATVGGVANTAVQLKPEKNRSIELGTKWDLLERRLSLTGALFQIQTTNARVTNPTDGSVSLAGDKQVRGVELGFSGNVTRELQVFGGYTLLDSEGRNLGLVNAGTATAPLYRPNAATGLPFANTPKHSASIWASYKPTAAWTLGLGAFYQDEVYGGYAYAAGTSGLTLIKRSVPGYTRVDAMVGYAVNKNVNLQLNVQNLTNKVYYNTAYSTHYANLAPGRQATLTANFSF